MKVFSSIFVLLTAFGILIAFGPTSVTAEESLRDKCRRITGASYIFQAYVNGDGVLMCVHPDIETGAIENKMNGQSTGYRSRFSGAEPDNPKAKVGREEQ